MLLVTHPLLLILSVPLLTHPPQPHLILQQTTTMIFLLFSLILEDSVAVITLPMHALMVCCCSLLSLSSFLIHSQQIKVVQEKRQTGSVSTTPPIGISLLFSILPSSLILFLPPSPLDDPQMVVTRAAYVLFYRSQSLDDDAVASILRFSLSSSSSQPFSLLIFW